MSIPLDRLYTYLSDMCNHDVIIYRFWPHGSKNPLDCLPLMPYTANQVMIRPHVICFDQECITEDWTQSDNAMAVWETHNRIAPTLHSKMILLHSEYNSQIVAQLATKNYIPVHWFCHGIIARDWFRFAQHDHMLETPRKLADKRFLVYNRSWTGTREYRLKFAELLVKLGLSSQCQMNFAFYDSETHYKQHRPLCDDWAIDDINLEDFFQSCSADSTASANYDRSDYQQKIVEIVLETIFDDQRISLTEKSLRPIATSTPFIIAGPPGSLSYLRRYGFETFAPWINEDYDQELHAGKRLNMIVNEMQRLATLDAKEFEELWEACRTVAKRNFEHFFSGNFENIVIKEYQQGMAAAIAQTYQHIDDSWYRCTAHLHQPGIQREITEFLQQHPPMRTAK